jgi:hypothetical protein
MIDEEKLPLIATASDWSRKVSVVAHMRDAEGRLFATTRMTPAQARLAAGQLLSAAVDCEIEDSKRRTFDAVTGIIAPKE